LLEELNREEADFLQGARIDQESDLKPDFQIDQLDGHHNSNVKRSSILKNKYSVHMEDDIEDDDDVDEKDNHLQPKNTQSSKFFSFCIFKL
jgi:hypothetical protein